MSKFRKKIVVPITLILVVCLVVGTLVIYDSLTSVEANASFNGISNIVSSHGKDSPFNIVEVVPSKQENNNMASIGYLIGGKEPVNLRQKLSTTIGENGSGTGSGASFRSFYMHRLFFEDYKDFVTADANDKSKPLFWSTYNESYTKGVDDCNTPLDLAGTETLEAGTKGYEIVRKDGGSYRLDTEYVPAVKDGNPSGNYNQNVDHYVYMPSTSVSEDGHETKPVRGYYGVVFKEADEHVNITNYDYFNAKTTDGLNLDVTKKAYKVKSAYAIADQHTMNSIAESDPHAAIYRIDNSDISLPYEYAGLAESYKKAEGDEAQAADKADNTEASNTADYDTYTYYTLQMEYVPSDEVVNEGVTYYEVDDEKTLFFEDQSGEYGAVLDEKEPYINLNPDNSQSETREMGYFNIKEGSQVYNFAGEGCGEYEIQKKENGVLDHPVNVTRIYTKGGFTNNELFRNGVFNQDGSGKSDNMSFNVQTVTPAEMDNINWSNVDLLYISGGDGSGSASYGKGNDIKGKTIFDVAKRVHESGFMMPVIVDYSLVKDNVDQPWNFGSCTNIQRLAALLCCSNYDELAIDKIDPNQYEISWCVNWNKIKFDTRVDSNHPNGYVNGNIYVIPGNTYKKPTDDDKGHGAAFLLQNFNTSFLDCTGKDKTETDFVNQARNQGFGEIAEYINSENKIRDIENKAGNKYELFDKKISKAIVISYIVSYADKRQEVQEKTSLNVLDIEPGAVSDKSTNAITYDMIKKWVGAGNCPSKENVTITRVTSSEFIGRIEDLNNYDMIYMGLVCDNNNKDENGDTVYNDSDMNGLIYTNVGDVAVVDINDQHYKDKNGNDKVLPGYKSGHAGLLESDYYHDGNNNRTGLDKTLTPISDDKHAQAINTYRYSGNDLTEKKKEQLENYVKAGYPLVLGKGIINERKVNDEYIDNCSVIYEFFNEVMNKENVFNVNSENNVSAGFVNSLAVEKPRIVLKQMEKVKLDDKLENDTEFDEVKDNKLIFEFTVNNNGGVDPNAQFELSLLLDINSDGKFSETQEKIAANDMKLYRDGQLVEPTRADDQSYDYYIQAGTMNYKLEYELPNGYVGVIPWKLKASQATNEFRYDSKSGYFYRKNTVEKEKIKILQIDTERTTTSTFNMADNKTFKDLLSKVNDFDVSITHVYANEYADKYKESKYYLNNYDMLVLGFGDMYSITNKNGCVDGIRNYIKSGKPVLFTHDTTSFSNASVGRNDWGYDFNKIIRDVVGMDRYGILSNEGLKSGATLTQNDSTSVLVNGSNKTIGTLFTEAKDYAKKNHTDIAYKPKSDKSVIVRQNQGFTYLNLSKYQSADTKYNNYYCYKGLQSYSYETTSAVQVNQGQITSYPFKIPETLAVAKTHRQYYQLDLNQDSDNDGESDIVVWYTLSDDKKYGTKKWPYHPYNASPKDVRNNYYIYTMGNVTYSGVGHSTVGSSEDEMKLYINTLIAAYSAGTHAPSVSVKEAPDEGARDLNNIYVTIDEAIEQENIANNADNNSAIVHDPNETNPTETVYFSIKDTNMVRGHEYTNEYVDFCVPVEKSDYDAAQNNNAIKNDYLTVNDGNNGSIYLKKVDINVAAADDNSAFNSAKTTALQSGIMYKAQIPLNLLPQGKNSQTIYVVGYSKIKTTANDNPQVTSTAYKTFNIQRVGLADLD